MIRRLVAVGLAASLVMAACGDDDADEGAEGTTTTAGGDETAGDGDIDRDASLVMVECCGDSSLDPHNQPYAGVDAWFPLFDRLTYIGTPEDPLADEISPMLAESWEYSDDGMELTLTLRDDATFNDGSPVDADAVKASLERAQASDYSAADALETVDAIEVVDDTTVRLVLNQPDAALPAALAAQAGAVINPAVLDDPDVDLDLAPPAAAGSGPFVLDSFEAGTSITYVRADDDYWDPEATHLARLEYVAQPDPNARLNGMRAGDYDVAVLFSRTVPQGDEMAESDDFDNYAIAGRAVSVLWLRHTNPELSDPLVRQAIAHAVDRSGIAEGALDGECTVIDQMWAPGVVGHDEDFENPYPYDLDRARELLDEAGVDDLTLDFIYPAGASQEVMATVLQASLGDIGVNVNVQGIPPSDTPAEFREGGHDGSVNAITGQADVSQIVQAELYDRNALAGDDETVAELADEGKTELDRDERDSIYQELQDYVLTEAWAIPICMANVSWVSQSNVVGVDRMPWNWSVQPAPRYLGVLAD